MYEWNDIETIVDNDRVLWLNEKYIEEEGLYQKNLRKITIKYRSHHRKHRYELVEKPRNKSIEFL